jgi:hypothetical protein
LNAKNEITAIAALVFPVLTIYPNQFFCQPHTPQLLFVLGGKEVDGLLVIILQF